MKCTNTRSESSIGDIDMRTIRQRVAAIKRTWTPDEVAARAAEGRSRRSELARLVDGWDLEDFDSDDSDAIALTLVG